MVSVELKNTRVALCFCIWCKTSKVRSENGWHVQTKVVDSLPTSVKWLKTGKKEEALFFFLLLEAFFQDVIFAKKSVHNTSDLRTELLLM